MALEPEKLKMCFLDQGSRLENTRKGRKVFQFQKRLAFFFLCLFVLFRTPDDGMMPNHSEGWSSPLTIPINTLISSANILIDTTRNNVLPASYLEYPLIYSN
jgi:hypothetical protein